MSHRVMRVLGGAAALAFLPAVISATPAMAKPCYGDCQPGVVRTQGVLKYDAPVGADDQITIAANASGFTVTDTTATFSAGPGCTMVNPHQAQCGASGSLAVRGLDGNDVITNSTALPSRLMGGAGNDRLVGGSGDDILGGEFGADVMQGGAGSDTASYSESAGRVAVTADLDGATGDDGSSDDGPAGARDTIASDVENLEGTIRDDVLIGNAGPNVINGGSNGDDQIQGLGGNDQLTAPGGGTINGGADTDHCVSDIRSFNGEPPDTFVGCETTEVIR
jgi:Ca2+-binding RTX toxin-like protein